jgi:hypothetical protein
MVPVAVMAQDVFTVDVTANRQVISQGVSGQGMLDRVSSSAFAKGSTYQQAVRDFGSGSLRWPNAGHSNLLITHWDNDHTIYYGAGDDYSTLAAGNIWDPLYNPANAAPRTELVDLDAFVDVINATGAEPVMLFTWRSAELWRVMGGTNNFYRDPAPVRMDGTVMPPAESDLLSSREMQFLENNRQLKNYYDLGGPDYPVVQIGGEVFIGWELGQEPWKDLYEPDQDKGVWIASTLRAYFEDLNEYAGSIGKNLKLMAQFKEANSGGHEIPTSVPFLRGEFDELLDYTGDIMTYYGCSMHYRHDWATWLNQSNMTWGFIVDDGEGTAQEIQDWMRSYTAAAGYPGIELIPHANGIGSADTVQIPNNYTRAKQGLVQTQFLMEMIEAGYPYACHYAGIKGEYTGSVGVNNGSATSFMNGQGYQYNPVVYASGLIGENVMVVNDRPARLVGTTLDSGNADGKTQVMVLESSAGQSGLAANGGALHPSITQVLHLYVLNKRASGRTVTLDFNQTVQDSFEVKRYAEGAEETAPVITPSSGAAVRDGADTSKVHVAAAPYSMTRVRIYVEGAASTTNRPPKFKAPVLFAAEAKTGAPYSATIAAEALDADGDMLTFVKTGGAGWLSVSTNGLLSGTPSSGSLGLNNVFVEVTDGTETNDAVLRITVAPGQVGGAGFVGWDTGRNGSPDQSTLDGLDAVLAGGDEGSPTGSDDQTWGSLDAEPLPGIGNHALKVKNNYVVTLSLTNNTGADLLLDGIYMDYSWTFAAGPQNFALEYTSGDLGSGPYTLFSTNATDQVFHNYDLPFEGVLTNRLLAAGDSARFSLMFTGGTTSRGDLDNLMLRAGGEPASAYEAWASLYSLTNGPSGNDDQDALNNLYEYGLGGDPTNSAHLSIIPVTFERSGDAFEYVYPRRQAPDSGVSYYLELTDDLVSGLWTNSGYTETGSGPIDAGFEAVTNEIPNAGKTNEFIRLRITAE